MISLVRQFNNDIKERKHFSSPPLKAALPSVPM